jgi:TrmH family RNA methyltransferase
VRSTRPDPALTPPRHPPAPLGIHNARVRRARALLRDRNARDADGVFVCEGPRLVGAALDHRAELLECFVGIDASPLARAVAERVAGSGIPVHELAEGVAARVGDTVHSQGIVALAPRPRPALADLAGADLLLVATTLGDPGNAGTLVRSAAAAGAGGVVLGSGSVDAYNPKAVRASAGACFAVRIVEGVPAVEIVEVLGAAGVRCIGATATGGLPPEALDLRAPVAFVLGHEAHGIDAAVALDTTVTIPMAAGESLNVAMAGTALLLEAARQRRAAGAPA